VISQAITRGAVSYVLDASKYGMMVEEWVWGAVSGLTSRGVSASWWGLQTEARKAEVKSSEPDSY
jgi:hypothetical protein